MPDIINDKYYISLCEIYGVQSRDKKIQKCYSLAIKWAEHKCHSEYNVEYYFGNLTNLVI
jgi:hypothetical protein